MMGQRQRAGRGTLFIIAMLLAASAALRLGSGVGKALAATPDAETAGEEMTAPTDCAELPLALTQAVMLPLPS